MTLLDQLRDAQADDYGAALDLYRELLGRRYDPDPGDVDKLRAVMTTLGISAADYQADAAAVTNVADLEKHILSADQLRDVAQRRDEARAAYASELRDLLKTMADTIEDAKLPVVVELLLPTVGPVPKGTPPFPQRRDEITSRWVAAQNSHMSAVGLHDQNAKQAAAIRAKHPRAFPPAE